MFCMHCGQQVEPDDRFCPACGGAVEAEPAPAPAPEAPAARAPAPQPPAPPSPSLAPTPAPAPTPVPAPPAPEPAPQATPPATRDATRRACVAWIVWGAAAFLQTVWPPILAGATDAELAEAAAGASMFTGPLLSLVLPIVVPVRWPWAPLAVLAFFAQLWLMIAIDLPPDMGGWDWLVLLLIYAVMTGLAMGICALRLRRAKRRSP